MRERRNILVVGGTGTGKTTLTNAILAYMAEVATRTASSSSRTPSEMQCAAENAVILRDDGYRLHAAAAEDHDAAAAGPDHRGRGPRRRRALALLKAWNTGHPGGVCTVHANTHVNAARAGLTRIEQLIQEASSRPCAS